MEQQTPSFSTNVRETFFNTDVRNADRLDGKRSIELLKSLNFPILPEGTTFQRPGVRFESYPGMAHSSSDREIRDLKAWLEECLKD